MAIIRIKGSGLYVGTLKAAGLDIAKIEAAGFTVEIKQSRINRELIKQLPMILKYSCQSAGWWRQFDSRAARQVFVYSGSNLLKSSFDFLIICYFSFYCGY